MERSSASVMRTRSFMTATPQGAALVSRYPTALGMSRAAFVILLAALVAGLAFLGFSPGREQASAEQTPVPAARELTATATSPCVPAPAARARKRTFYLSAAGDDSNPGTIERPWQSLGKLHRAALRPGDSVLLRGGDSWTEHLEPTRSGTRKAPIVFASYGAGRAHLQRGIKLTSLSSVAFENLRVSGALQGVAGRAAGTGSKDIRLCNLEITDVVIGINSANPADTGWLIWHNRIANTGDSGLILLGSDFLVARNAITDTGQDTSIDYGKHGIYAKGPRLRLIGNQIEGFQANGISIRFPSAVVQGNRINGGPIGVAYFQDSDAAGTSRIAYNTIWDVTSAGIYLDGSTSESFVIANNSIKTASGRAIDVKPMPNLTIANNLVTGTQDATLAIRPPTGSYVEHHNLWHRDNGAPTFLWNAELLPFDKYRSASGQGADDVLATPLLVRGLSLASKSPAIDAGTTDVAGLPYRAGCTGLAFRYCGAAPDLGAVEYVANR